MNRVLLVNKKVGRASGQTFTPAPITAATPAPSAAPLHTPATGGAAHSPTQPPQELATFFTMFSGTRTDTKLSLYHQNLRLFGNFGFINVYFRYHDPLPEGATLRITKLNGKSGHFGEAVIGPADLKDAPKDMLGTSIYSTSLSEDVRTATVECIDPATGEVLFDISLQQTGDKFHLNDEYIPPEATPSAPPAGPTASPTRSVILRSKEPVNLIVSEKPAKYLHYAASVQQEGEYPVLQVYFRYHDPLPESAVLRLTRCDDVPGAYGEAPILPATLEGASEDLLSAVIEMPTVSSTTGRYTLEAWLPGAEEPLFTITLEPERITPAPTQKPYNPSEPHYNPVPDTPRPGQSVFDWWNGLAGGYPGYGY